MELICPAGTLAAFRDAVDAGADAVYCGFRDETNARNFPGLNLTRDELAAAIGYARPRGVKTLVAINTFMRQGDEQLWLAAVADAVALGADALILADIGLLAHTAERWPEQRLHLSVQAGAANPDSIAFYVEAFGVRRVVLPRVLTIADVAVLSRAVPCETEVFVYGGLCVMEEGRCSLSSYATGRSPNMHGVCSPASHVRYREEGSEIVSVLGDFTINRLPAGEPAGYPTICKGRFVAAGEARYLFEDPVSLDASQHLGALAAAGVAALKIEGRQRGRAYVAKVVTEFRRALDGAGAAAPGRLAPMSEGLRTTAGSYRKGWR